MKPSIEETLEIDLAMINKQVKSLIRKNGQPVNSVALVILIGHITAMKVGLAQAIAMMDVICEDTGGDGSENHSN